jgi:hypothetical protein
MGLGLDPDTVRRLQECFGGHPCHRCGRPAPRLCRGRFFCAEHLPGGRPGPARPPRRYTGPKE